VITIGDEEVPDDQRMLELLPQSDHPSDGVLGEDYTDDALGLEDVSRPEGSPPMLTALTGPFPNPPLCTHLQQGTHFLARPARATLSTHYVYADTMHSFTYELLHPVRRSRDRPHLKD
jgi:hypothetical protein